MHLLYQASGEFPLVPRLHRSVCQSNEQHIFVFAKLPLHLRRSSEKLSEFGLLVNSVLLRESPSKLWKRPAEVRMRVGTRAVL